MRREKRQEQTKPDGLRISARYLNERYHSELNVKQGRRQDDTKHQQSVAITAAKGRKKMDVGRLGL